MSGENIKIKLQEYLNINIQNILNNYQSVKSSGSLGQSLTSVIEEVNSNFIGKIEGNSYITQLIHGRRPGSMPPINDIKDWVIKKGIGNGANTDSIAFAIAKSIEKQGIKVPNQYNTGGIIEGVGNTDNISKEVSNILIDSTREQIKNIFK